MSGYLRDAAGDVVMPLQLTDKLTYIRQHVDVRLLMVKGEWGLNLDEGVPYLENDTVSESEAILGQKNAEARARAVFRTQIAGTPGIVRVERTNVSFEGRNLSASYRAIADTGEAIEGTI